MVFPLLNINKKGGNSMSYILKQYDNNLAYFDIFYDIEGFRVENFKIVESNKHLLPLNLKQDNEGMAK